MEKRIPNFGLIKNYLKIVQYFPDSYKRGWQSFSITKLLIVFRRILFKSISTRKKGFQLVIFHIIHCTYGAQDPIRRTFDAERFAEVSM